MRVKIPVAEPAAATNHSSDRGGAQSSVSGVCGEAKDAAQVSAVQRITPHYQSHFGSWWVLQRRGPSNAELYDVVTVHTELNPCHIVDSGIVIDDRPGFCVK